MREMRGRLTRRCQSPQFDSFAAVVRHNAIEIRFAELLVSSFQLGSCFTDFFAQNALLRLALLSRAANLGQHAVEFVGQ